MVLTSDFSFLHRQVNKTKTIRCVSMSFGLDLRRGLNNNVTKLTMAGNEGMRLFGQVCTPLYACRPTATKTALKHIWHQCFRQRQHPNEKRRKDSKQYTPRHHSLTSGGKTTYSGTDHMQEYSATSALHPNSPQSLSRHPKLWNTVRFSLPFQEQGC